MFANRTNHGADSRCGLLHFVSTLQIKSDTKWLVQLARYLDPRSFRMGVACFYEGGPIAKELNALGVQTFNLETPGERDPRAIFRAKRLIDEFNADIVHTHLLRADLFAATAARLARVPVIVSTIYAMGEFRRATRRRTDCLLDTACRWLPHHVIAVSNAVKQDCVNRMGMSSDCVSVIRTGIDPPRDVDLGRVQPLRRQWDVPPEAKVVLVLARLSYEKGIDTLIHAACRLKDSNPGARFVVVGEGPDRPGLEDMIRQLQLEDYVKLPGFDADVWSALAASDIVCLPSKSEGLPNVLLEAMVAGRPVVATAVGGVPEVVNDEGNGLLVEPNNALLLSQAISRVLNDQPLADRFVREGLRTVTEGFHARDVSARYEALYTQLLGAGSPRRVAQLAVA